MQKPANRSVILLALVLGIGVICLAGGILGSRILMQDLVGNDPQTAKKIAQSIVDYSLPEGYLEHSSVNFGILQLAYLTPGGGDPEFHARHVIMLVAIPSDYDVPDDDIRLELQTNLLRSSEEVSTMAFIREESGTIRGEDRTLKVFESFGQYDPPTRMVYTPMFPGKSGRVMVLFAGPIESWDQKVVHQFLGSIR